MRRIFLVVPGLILAVSLAVPLARADDKKAPEGERAKESYTLGYRLGSNLRLQEVDIDFDVLVSAMRSGLAGEKPALSVQDMNAIVKELRKKTLVRTNRKFEELAALNLGKSKVFLAENKAKEGVITLPSGLQYKVEKEGSGPVPKATDHVVVSYRGFLADGLEFDSTGKRGGSTAVTVKGVIKGWTEALQMMKTGSKWRLFVPPELAYGKRRFGRIPPNSLLIFDLELLSIGEPSQPVRHDPTVGKKTGADDDEDHPADGLSD